MTDLPDTRDKPELELWVNGERFVVKRVISVAEVRALPSPPIPGDHDLFVEREDGDTKLPDRGDFRFPVRHNRRVYSTPRFINGS